VHPRDAEQLEDANQRAKRRMSQPAANAIHRTSRTGEGANAAGEGDITAVVRTSAPAGCSLERAKRKPAKRLPRWNVLPMPAKRWSTPMKTKLLHEAGGKRTFAVILRTDDEAMHCLEEFAERERIGGAQVTAIGARATNSPTSTGRRKPIRPSK
jgi:hypothetical protein